MPTNKVYEGQGHNGVKFGDLLTGQIYMSVTGTGILYIKVSDHALGGSRNDADRGTAVALETGELSYPKLTLGVRETHSVTIERIRS